MLPSGRATLKSYDEDYRLILQTVGSGTNDAATTSFAYDAVGNLTDRTDPNNYPGGPHWHYAYDKRNRLLSVTDPVAADRGSANVTVLYDYDLAGNKVSEQRANDQVITYDSYDANNRLTKMTVGQWPTPPAVSFYSWTKAGKVASFTDPLNHVYSYGYDELNRLVTTTYPPDGGGMQRTETKQYDPAGNLAVFKNRGGLAETFTYDPRNRETNYHWSNSIPQDRRLTYDNASRVLSCYTTDTFINFSYFNDGQLQSQEEWGRASSGSGDGNHHTLNYSYDEDGDRATIGLAGVIAFNYDYTGRNQLRSLTQQGNGYVYASYGYDQNGNMATRQLLNGVTSSYGYDAMNRVSDISHPFTGGTETIHHDYDAVGNRTATQRNGSTGDAFGYDSNNQLRSLLQPDPVSGQTVTTGLTYDASGNRSMLTKGSAQTSYGVNGLNQYSTVDSGSLTYTGNGNLNSYNGWSYTYDALNRMIVASHGGTATSFYYDGLNRQVARSTSGGGATIYSVWDGWNLAAEYAPGNVLANLPVRAGGDLLEKIESGLPTVFFYPDGNGSTTHVADGSGHLLEKYTYDAGGTPTVYDPSGGFRSGGSLYHVENLFTGQKWYGDLGLYDLRNRFYSPSMGRFLQPDPIGFAGDFANIYRYGGNNPVNRSDPSGLGFWGWVARLFSRNGTAPSQSPNSNPSNPSNPNNGVVTRYGAPPTGSNIPETQTYTPIPGTDLYARVDNNVINGYSNQGVVTSNGTRVALTIAIGVTGTSYYDDAQGNSVHTYGVGVYADSSTGEVGWYETSGPGQGVDNSGTVGATAVFGDASVFSSPFRNENGGFLDISSSVHLDPSTGVPAGLSLGFGGQLPIDGSVTETTTTTHPFGHVSMSLLGPMLPPGM